MLSAVAAAHIGLDDAHLGGRNVKGLRELVANPEWALGSGPNGQVRAVPLGHRCARLKRAHGRCTEWCTGLRVSSRLRHGLRD